MRHAADGGNALVGPGFSGDAQPVVEINSGVT
jgi:hypothetical protein